MSQLKEKYKKEVVPRMMESFGYKNVMEVPHLEKIALNIGLGEAIQNAKAMEAAEKDFAAFRLRAGMPIGLKVTLRGERMHQFFERLVNVTLPRMREFRGVSRNSFDGRGNYTIGFKEQTIFPEIDYDKVDKVRGLEVSIMTSAKTDEEGRQLLELLGVPFARE
jgi:large subunit ribosomal protein L5